MSGDWVGGELKAAIPRPAHWRLALLPEVLTDAEIDELLSSFDQAFPSRLRAYTMVRCVIDLGLPSSEVVKLQLTTSTDGTIKLLRRERRLRPICKRSGPRRRTGPYLFAMLPPR
ncbi:hypothetical protein MES5069_450010 [Mesorhizobium escarrei]|uniref:Tyr recombinase domain-containing protein n=2 Tax=Mesorhizobium escarrei TaxID=666018 RepID=A0ABM9E798_9HYPH|nr:hypothetical protein MES5069_450010 [Mesorhizobium escarrei]